MYGGTQAKGGEHTRVKGSNNEEEEAYFRFHVEALNEHVSAPVILVGGLRTSIVMGKPAKDVVTDLSVCRRFIREPHYWKDGKTSLLERWKDGDLEKAKCI